MSTDVYIYVTRKEDGRPQGEYYLGGNHVQVAMHELYYYSVDATEGLDVLALKDASVVRDLIAKNKEHFYIGSTEQELDKDYLDKSDCDDFKYWLVFRS